MKLSTPVLLTYGDLLVAAVFLAVLVLVLAPGWRDRQERHAEDRAALVKERRRMRGRWGF